MIIRCPRCRRLRNAHAWPFVCQCGETIAQHAAVDAAHELPSRRPGRLRRPAQPLNRRPTRAVNHLAERCATCPQHPCAGTDCRLRNCLYGPNWQCPAHRWEYRPRYVTTVERTAAALALAARLPEDVALVAGVPRSGLAPAATIAEALHLPLATIHPREPLRLLPAGHRLSQPADTLPAGRLAIVDDTAASGTSYRELRQAHPRLFASGRALACVCFASPEAAADIDLAAEILPTPHLLEWNLANSIYTATTAWDIDGVILHERGPLTFRPWYLPRRGPVPLIATGRLERHRAVTEARLAALGIRYHRLAMAQTDEDFDLPAAHKARAYAATPAATLFIESCPEQAAAIHRLTGKPVLCPTDGALFLPETPPT